MSSPPPLNLYHRIFHIIQATLHDPWVKRFRLVAFFTATFIASQLLFHSLLDYLGFGGLLPSSALALLAASAIWLVAYPAMWVRMILVFGEMEARKETQALVHALEDLHRHKPGSPASNADRP